MAISAGQEQHLAPVGVLAAEGGRPVRTSRGPRVLARVGPLIYATARSLNLAPVLEGGNRASAAGRSVRVVDDRATPGKQLLSGRDA